VPLLRGREPIGAMSVARRDPGLFSEHQIGLLKTFADQAMIAIENVRLFKELQAQTQALSRSVNQLTALGEVGRSARRSISGPSSTRS
jgi:GAF domain-containing protein